jgi:hypothetical protein
MKFDKSLETSTSKTNQTINQQRFHVYHCDGGEIFLKRMTRINIFFIGGNSILLALEILNPFFGFWHGFSQSLIVLFSLIGSRMLHHYSSRMVSDIWLLEDGKNVHVHFMNAFFTPKSETFKILNFGYL